MKIFFITRVLECRVLRKEKIKFERTNTTHTKQFETYLPNHALIKPR